MSALITAMAAGTLALNVALAISLVALLNARGRARLRALCRVHGRLAIFLLALLSMAATLWMQYGAGLLPCLFCWYQRICMYPLVLIAGIAIVKDTDLSELADYVLGLSVVGGAIALYQHLLQVLPQGALIPCSASDECAIRSVFEFGYITLPWMALSVFAVTMFIALLGRKRSAP